MKPIWIQEGEEVCANCRHYHQHYGFQPWDGKYLPLNCGHCAKPRHKHRRPGDACANFVRR